MQDILEDVRSRFELIEAGELLLGRSGWPDLWLFESKDRAEFIRYIRWFSSNYSPQFGRLLMLLVDGIRVRGPLFPDFIEGQPKVAFIDGQGLGHSPDSSASVTTRVTRRFGQVDVILLVDNAQQPMQASPLSVLRAVASSGHHGKLAIAFTHFDQIKGQASRPFRKTSSRDGFRAECAFKPPGRSWRFHRQGHRARHGFPVLHARRRRPSACQVTVASRGLHERSTGQN